MNVAISGSRTFTDRRFVELVVERLLARGDHIIIGDAPNGVDDFAWDYLKQRVHWAHWTRYIAHWTLHGRAAGHERNGRMLDHPADQLIAIFAPGEFTPGTQNCVQQAFAKSIPIFTFHEGAWFLSDDLGAIAEGWREGIAPPSQTSLPEPGASSASSSSSSSREPSDPQVGNSEQQRASRRGRRV